jgi:hypothetical protein
MNNFLNKIRRFFSYFSLSNKKILKVNNDELTQLKAELQMRHQEAVQFKLALENKNAEIDLLRSGINRSDLQSVNEAIATFNESFEFSLSRAQSSQVDDATAMSEISKSVDELFTAASLIKVRPKEGDLLIDQTPGSITIFSKVPAPSIDLKGRLKEVRNSWVGFTSNDKTIIISQSRVSVYV